MKRIYFDVCCFNRPFDDQLQEKIRLEAEAILLIFNHIKNGDWQLVSSEVINWEIEKTPDTEKKIRMKELLKVANETVLVEEADMFRAKQLIELGLRDFDALHIACAEKAKLDVFFTTDKKLENFSIRNYNILNININNPLNWIMEIL